MRYIALLSLVSTVLISCEKERYEITEPVLYDTVFPSEYIPAWPGSYWIYQNTNGSVSKDSVTDYRSFGTEPQYQNEVLHYYPMQVVWNMRTSL